MADACIFPNLKHHKIMIPLFSGSTLPHPTIITLSVIAVYSFVCHKLFWYYFCTVHFHILYNNVSLCEYGVYQAAVGSRHLTIPPISAYDQDLEIGEQLVYTMQSG